jgi:hypothetical protein
VDLGGCFRQTAKNISGTAQKFTKLKTTKFQPVYIPSYLFILTHPLPIEVRFMYTVRSVYRAFMPDEYTTSEYNKAYQKSAKTKMKLGQTQVTAEYLIT